MTPRKFGYQALTIGLSAVGALVFIAIDLPLPFLFGPLAACLLAALVGLRLEGAGQVAVAARTILGVAVGASITPDVVHELPRIAASALFVPVYVCLIGLIGVPFFTRIYGFDRATAYYAAMPGGLPDMVVFGGEAGADVRALALIHATRILLTVAIAPVLLVQLFDVTLANPVGAPARDIPIDQALLLCGAALVGWKGGEKLGLIGPTILGPLIVTAVLSLTGVIHQRPPAEAIQFAQFFIGGGIGVSYVGITLREVRKDVVAGLVFALILAILAFLMMEIVVQAGFAGPIEGFLSYTPGGQAEMAILAIIAGADLGFVVVHHLLRLFVVIAGAPVFAHFIGIRSRKRK